MKKLPPKVRTTLIAIGRAELMGSGAKDADVVSLHSMDVINRQSPEFWGKAAADLSDSQLAELTCGLAHVEAELRWLGGSASGVIWLFQALVARNVNIELLDEVSGWVLANSRNPYNPFGTQVSLGARNYSEYRELASSRAVEINNRIADEQKIEKHAKDERKIRREMAAAGAAARGTEVRAAVIQSMRDLSLSEKLEKIAGDPIYPPQFFPTSIADSATQADVDALPESVRLELARRLKGKRKGPWRNFRRRLLASLGPVWNKKPWCV